MLLRLFLLLLGLTPLLAHAHGDQQIDSSQRTDRPELHVAYDYDNCYIDLHPELTRRQMRQLVREFGSGYAFTSMSGPRTLGPRGVDVGVALRMTSIDDTDGAWNHSWTHPGEDHWLGPVRLPILQARVGLSERTDLEAMFSFGGSNWGIGGLGLRFAVLGVGGKVPVDVSIRPGLQFVYGGPELLIAIAGVDGVVGKTFGPITPYGSAGVATALGIERTDEVDHGQQLTLTPRVGVGAELALGPARIAVEGVASDVAALNIKVGAAF